jgi:beta-N-acetylhexosaminidase
MKKLKPLPYLCQIRYVIFLSCLCIGTLFGELSLEEKVGQLLIVHFHGEEANAESAKLLQEAHVGGFILYGWSNGLTSVEQVKRLTETLQKSNHSSLPLWIGVDEEGGRVSRLSQLFPRPPSEKASYENRSVYQDTLNIARQLNEVGINLNFAPVVDVNSNPENPIIGDRAYSASPQEVVEAGREALKAYRETGILCTLKHFPGHGDTKSDSHHALPTVSKSLAELNACELLPFKALQNEAPLIMTAHLLVPAIDPNSPITFSKKALTELLKEQWGFQGVIISDSLVMKALKPFAPTPEEAALQALLAGCDVLCLGGKLLQEASQDELTTDDILRIHRYLVEAVKKGNYPESQLNASISRIQKIKSL